MKNYIQFIEATGKFVNVDYKIIVTDLKDNPELLVTDFKIINHEDKKLKIAFSSCFIKGSCNPVIFYQARAFIFFL